MSDNLFASIIIAVLVCIAVTISFFAREAHAQFPPGCAPYEQIAANLSTKYEESIRFRDINEKGNLFVELWVSEEKNTSSIVIVDTNGLACIKFGGIDPQFINEEYKEETSL